jgi:hypothetical protein
VEQKREDMDRALVAGRKQVVNVVVNIAGMEDEDEGKREDMDRSLVAIYIYINIHIYIYKYIHVHIFNITYR